MAETLTASLLESHRAVERGRAGPGRAARPGRVPVLPDHVVLEGDMAALALRLFESSGVERLAPEVVLVCAQGDPLRRIHAGAEQAFLERTAQRRGAVFSRYGNGPSHQVYAARFGAPGRLVLGAEPRIAGCGALGSLALAVSAVELAAVLAGAALELDWPEVFEIRLFGRPPAWLAGEDVVLELRRRLAERPPRGGVLEFHLIEPQALAFHDRAVIAARARSLGALTALFPSDQVTRRFLKAQGREADWKPLAAAADQAATKGLELDFSDLEPLVARPGAGEVVRLRELGDAPVGTVWVGPEAPVADLTRFARALGAAGVDARVACAVALGNRQVHETAARGGLLAALATAGVRVQVDDGTTPRPARGGTGLSLACGASARLERAGWHLAGVEACAAAAVAAAIVDPRARSPGAEPIRGMAEAETYVVNDRLLARPTPGGAIEPDAREGPPPLSPGITGPLRGTVLLKLGDHVDVERILRWGARVRPQQLRVEALAGFAFAGLDPGFASRAAAQGGGFVVAGRVLGGGGRREQVALVAVTLGIRGMLARSFDPEFRRLLRQHGVLGLRLASDGDADQLAAGDELEIPDLPEGLEPGKPLVVRNLTQGSQVAVHHDLDPAGVEEMRAGGLLARLRQGPRAA